MPVYDYVCAHCGAEISVRRGMREPPLTLCPKCGEQTLKRRLTVTGISVRGNGCPGRAGAGLPSSACSCCPHYKE